MIDEELARRAKEAYSFSDYIKNSATESWEDKINVAKQYLIENNIENKEEILERYKKKTSAWINKENSIIASCPSIMITGGSNFPVKKKEKQNEIERKHYESYDYTFNIKEYLPKIRIKNEIKQNIEQKEYLYKDIKVVQNIEDNRLQLFFDYKPSEEIRDILKSNGYKWSGKNGCWQRQLTQNALNNFNNIKDMVYKNINKEEIEEEEEER